ncbi:MAG TPA: zinc ribbon domain-containing protein, partial [Desulfobacteraceae bacterium]|nr:zinc ribbon domain-containing protein [Desulfobacteraceae bacterium]
MMSSALDFLDDKYICPHCHQEMTLCDAPPVHVGDGLGWGCE